MQKPYRFVVGRVSSYAEEAAAFLRRRRHRSRPYARIWGPDGAIDAYEPSDPGAEELFGAASALLGSREG